MKLDRIPEKILVVNVNWMGDVLFSFPLLASLKGVFPEAKLTCWVVPRCAQLLENQPCVDEVLLFDERGQTRSFAAKLRFLQCLRREKFDLVFLLHRSFSRALICALAGIPQRVGYATWKRWWLLTHPVWVDSGSRPHAPQDWIRHGKHKSEYFLDLARAVGVGVKRPWYEFHVGQGEKKRARDYLSRLGVSLEKPLVIVHPGANWLLKRWPEEFFSGLVERFIQNGIQVLVTGSSLDRSLIERIVHQSSDRSLVWALAGGIPLSDLAAIFQIAQLLVANDTGPMHLASAVGTAVVALFGPTQPHLTGPYGRGTIRVIRKEVGCNEDPCYNLGCHENICMRVITVDEVWQVCQELLAGLRVSELAGNS